ncbi:hypothetical protein M441DRAFT_227685 [Trichoderma asperellum CBS 433.97]|uniref:Uncharacterized protein n=1 Tax=Trichoderma asperellum (strain ATCC 204424 / CBS 433.97 / NBRC 101777) TaxID=1042311 RepID=A0A2T3ZQ69_TRIA4|nr:hypothetical protein M441DRAFT_227685 [Trichoderma asperellum CBS 433.97]PTB46946.1 hypothetical protein M441DRAFT_227685 [Trichoderma asperellum CBS 433.97]
MWYYAGGKFAKVCTWRACGGRWQTSQEVASMQDLRRAALEVQQVLVLLFSIPEQRRLSATWRCTPKQRASLQYNSNEMDGERESIKAFRQWFGTVAGLAWSGLVRSRLKKGKIKDYPGKDAEPRMFNCPRDFSVVFQERKLCLVLQDPYTKWGKHILQLACTRNGAGWILS